MINKDERPFLHARIAFDNIEVEVLLDAFFEVEAVQNNENMSI